MASGGLTAGYALLKIVGDWSEAEKGTAQFATSTQSRFASVGGKIQTIMKAASVAIGAAFVGAGVQAFRLANDVEQSSLRVAVALGQPIEEAGRFGDIIATVWKHAFGDSVDEVAAAVQSVGTQMKTMGDISDQELTVVTEKAMTVADVFDKDVSKVMNAVVALMDKFGLTSAEAFDFVSAGFMKGLNAGDDFLETITEYAIQFDSGGSSAGQFFSVMQTGLQQGIMGTDKAADMWKEFQVRVLDGSTSTHEALTQLGFDADAFMANLASGQMSVDTAFQLVLAGLVATDDKSIQMQAGFALMGAQFEDLGGKAIAQIDATGVSMDSLGGSTDQLGEMYRGTMTQLTELWRSFQVEVFLPMGEAMLGVLKENMPQIQEMFTTLAEHAGDFAKVFEAVMDLMVSVIVPVITAVASFAKENEGLFKGIAGGALFVGLFGSKITALVTGIMGLIPWVTSLAGSAGLGSLTAAVAAAIGGVSLGGIAGLGSAIAAFLVTAAPLLATAGLIAVGTYLVMEMVGAVNDLWAAQDQLAASTARLSGAEEEANRQLEEKGVQLDRAAMAEMEYTDRLHYRADAEKFEADALARAWFEFYAGRTESEDEFAQMRSLMLNDQIGAEEAAIAVSKGLGEEKLRALAQSEGDTTTRMLDELGIRETASQTSSAAITGAALADAQTRQRSWIDESYVIVDSQAAAADATVSLWGRAVDGLTNMWSRFTRWLSGLWAQIIGSGVGQAPAIDAPGMATGGMIETGGLVQVHRDELVLLPSNAEVVPRQHTAAVAAAMQGGGGGVNLTISGVTINERSDADRLYEYTVTRLRDAVQAARGDRGGSLAMSGAR